MAVLDEYRRKRDFQRTPEPRAARRRAAASNRFVVQWHKARRDHYDFRLEIDGVLKSWAVTRGPSARPGTRRLAVRTEDHPLAYADFEGVIPKQSYGAGPVMLWDEGTFVPDSDDPAGDIDAGSLKITLYGKRMKGRWALVRLKGDDGGRENWLLLKDRDSHAESDDSLAQRYTTSVRSDRSFEEIIAGKPPRKARASAALPAFHPPMLCRTADAPPQGEEWIYEMKYDGYRLQIALAGGRAVVRTRRGHDWSDRFPGLAAAASEIEAASAILDGEAVVLDENGVSDFPRLLASLDGSAAGQRILFMAFDLLHLDGHSLVTKPLGERKEALAKLLEQLPADGTIRLAPTMTSDPDGLFASVAAAGAEGLIAKIVTSVYVTGRSPAWVKIKARKRDDAVVVGWYASQKGGRKLASLAVALKGKRGLTYAGRVGTGVKSSDETELLRRLAPLARTAPVPGLANADQAPAGIKWVEPRLTAAIVYAATTGSGMLRGAAYLGLREDEEAPAAPRRSAAAAEKRRAPRTPPKAAPKRAKQETKPVPLTSPERVVFPATGMTKGEVAAYYARVAKWMTPHLDNRPVSLVRAPENVERELFFQRHPMPAMKAGIVRIPAPDRPRGDYMALEGALGLATVVQFGAIEIHLWGATLPDLDAPDRFVLDLDPAEDVPFAAVVEAARTLRKILEASGLRSFPMVTGGKGVHVVAPLDRSQSWEEIELYTGGLARTLARAEPQRFIAKSSIASRRGRIFIDWLRNKRSATAIAPYALRARKIPTLAMPVSWTGLGKLTSASQFRADAPLPRSDPWRGFFAIRQCIPRAALDILRRA